jgi:hypothetical protein
MYNSVAEEQRRNTRQDDAFDSTGIPVDRQSWTLTQAHRPLGYENGPLVHGRSGIGHDSFKLDIRPRGQGLRQVCLDQLFGLGPGALE